MRIRRAKEQSAAQAATGAVVRAEDAADQAAEAVAHADDAAEEATEAVSAAVAAGLPADALLLDEGERRRAAQASVEQPFGVRGAASSRRGPVRQGFLLTFGGLLAVGLGFAVVEVRHQLVLLLVAMFVAIGLDPGVRFLVRRGLSRRLAVGVVSVAALALLVGFIVAVAAPLGREATQLIDSVPDYAAQLRDQNSTLGSLNARLHLTERLQAEANKGLATQTASGLLSFGGAVAAGAFDTLIVLVLIVYFLADLPRITAAAYRLAPRHRRPRVGLLGDAVIARVGGYVLGNVATSVIAFGFAYVALLLLHVPYALVLAVTIGVLDLVPLVGSTIGGAIAALVALVTVSVTTAVVVVVFTILYRLFADYLVNPSVLRRTVDVSPLVTVVSVVLGGALLGVVGALVAVPTAAAISLLLSEVVYPQRDEEVLLEE